MDTRTHLPTIPRDPRYADEWRGWAAQWQWDRFVTLAFNQEGVGRPLRGYEDPRVFALKDKLGEWDRRMQRKVVGSNWSAIHDHRMFCLYTLEKPTANPHWHGLIHFFNADDNERARQGKQFDTWADATWKKLHPAGDVNVQVVNNGEGAIRYVAKEVLDMISFEYWVPPDEFWRP